MVKNNSKRVIPKNFNSEYGDIDIQVSRDRLGVNANLIIDHLVAIRSPEHYFPISGI